VSKSVKQAADAVASFVQNMGIDDTTVLDSVPVGGRKGQARARTFALGSESHGVAATVDLYRGRGIVNKKLCENNASQKQAERQEYSGRACFSDARHPPLTYPKGVPSGPYHRIPQRCPQRCFALAECCSTHMPRSRLRAASSVLQP